MHASDAERSGCRLVQVQVRALVQRVFSKRCGRIEQLATSLSDRWCTWRRLDQSAQETRAHLGSTLYRWVEQWVEQDWDL